MSGLDAPIGMTVASLGALGVPAAIELARLAEELGYRSYWTAETVGTESFALLAAAGAAAPGLDLGTGVIPLQLRSPALAAMGAATLQALHPDREILLGVGTSSPVVTGRWHGVPHGERPLARMREYLQVLRLCLSGETVSFAGEFYRLDRFRLGVRLGERRPRLVVGALSAGMLRLAGELADGVLLNYLPASHVPWSVARVREGGLATIYAYVHVGVVADRADALGPARRDLYSYAVVDAYARSFEQAGFGAEVADIRARQAAGDREGAVQAVSEAMVDAIDVTGDAAVVRSTVEAYVRSGVEVPIVMPLPWGPDRRAVAEATLRAATGALP